MYVLGVPSSDTSQMLKIAILHPRTAHVHHDQMFINRLH
jgi:hypothetical protein